MSTYVELFEVVTADPSLDKQFQSHHSIATINHVSTQLQNYEISSNNITQHNNKTNEKKVDTRQEAKYDKEDVHPSNYSFHSNTTPTMYVFEDTKSMQRRLCNMYI